ncbi:unnamed protein product, partial [marine sediment metagenome]
QLSPQRSQSPQSKELLPVFKETTKDTGFDFTNAGEAPWS